jgi:acetyl-CoA C-acetyltransferase
LAEPFYQRPVGLDHVSVAGLLASQYLSTTDATEEDLITIASRAWERGAGNLSIEAPTYGAQDVRSAAKVADPLNLLQISRPVDGAVAILIAAESVASSVTEHPVWITGMGSAMDSQYLAERTPGRMDAAAAAADRAFRQAGIKDRSTIGLAEVSGTSAPAEAMVVEALGLAPRGRAVDAYGADAAVELNPSGGALPADPVMATGLVRLHEAAERLSGRSQHGTSANKAVVHGAGGLGMQNHCVLTVEV